MDWSVTYKDIVRLLAIEAAARTLCENVTHVGPFSIPAVDQCDLIVLRKALGVSA